MVAACVNISYKGTNAKRSHVKTQESWLRRKKKMKRNKGTLKANELTSTTNNKQLSLSISSVFPSFSRHIQGSSSCGKNPSNLHRPWVDSEFVISSGPSFFPFLFSFFGETQKLLNMARIENLEYGSCPNNLAIMIFMLTTVAVRDPFSMMRLRTLSTWNGSKNNTTHTGW
jgi:hypothetical protein